MSVPKKYKCIFFDLDHTLWDYEANSKTTLEELYHAYKLGARGVPDSDSLYRQFRQINLQLWDLYDRGLITHDVIREKRFKEVLGHFGVDDNTLNEKMTADYYYHCPKKGSLMPHALQTLEYLSSHYKLTIITNGFEEIQNVKLAAGNIQHFFNHIITSQKAGHRKPSRQIFDYAMNINDIQCCDAIMIGDNLLTDISGARNATIDTVFFNPDKTPHQAQVNHEILCLSELQKIL